jgi:excisionase family DNA binding protein
MAKSTTANGLLDLDGVATRLGVGERYVRRLVEERRIPYRKIGRYLRFDPAEVEAWIEHCRVDAERPTVERRRA